MEIIYEYNKIFQELSLSFKEDPNFNISENNATLLIMNAIENDDIELINLLIFNNVRFSESILDFIGSSSEKVFLDVLKNINKNQKDFNWNYSKNIWFDLVESNSSTDKMFQFLIEKIDYNIVNIKKEEVPILFKICFLGKNKILDFLIKKEIIKESDLLMKYKNITLINLVEKVLPYNTYINAISIF